MSVRADFVVCFGEEQAARIEAAAEEHANGINDVNRGSDPFKWALLITIGYQCIEIDRYRAYHEITAPWDDVRRWIVDHAQLGEHDGDMDYIAFYCGKYNEFVGEPAL